MLGGGLALVISVYILCEGRTESSFVQKRARYLNVGTKKHLSAILSKLEGGAEAATSRFERLHAEHSQPNCIAITVLLTVRLRMFDYYGLPPTNFPGKELSSDNRTDTRRKSRDSV